MCACGSKGVSESDSEKESLNESPCEYVFMDLCFSLTFLSYFIITQKEQADHWPRIK